MSATETTAAVPAEEVKAVETPAPAPEAAPAAETPVVVSYNPSILLLFINFNSRKHLRKRLK